VPCAGAGASAGVSHSPSARARASHSPSTSAGAVPSFSATGSASASAGAYGGVLSWFRNRGSPSDPRSLKGDQKTGNGVPWEGLPSERSSGRGDGVRFQDRGPGGWREREGGREREGEGGEGREGGREVAGKGSAPAASVHGAAVLPQLWPGVPPCGGFRESVPSVRDEQHE